MVSADGSDTRTFRRAATTRKAASNSGRSPQSRRPILQPEFRTTAVTGCNRSRLLGFDDATPASAPRAVATQGTRLAISSQQRSARVAAYGCSRSSCCIASALRHGHELGIVAAVNSSGVMVLTSTDCQRRYGDQSPRQRRQHATWYRFRAALAGLRSPVRGSSASSNRPTFRWSYPTSRASPPTRRSACLLRTQIARLPAGFAPFYSTLSRDR